MVSHVADSSTRVGEQIHARRRWVDGTEDFFGVLGTRWAFQHWNREKLRVIKTDLAFGEQWCRSKREKQKNFDVVSRKTAGDGHQKSWGCHAPFPSLHIVTRRRLHSSHFPPVSPAATLSFSTTVCRPRSLLRWPLPGSARCWISPTGGCPSSTVRAASSWAPPCTRTPGPATQPWCWSCPAAWPCMPPWRCPSSPSTASPCGHPPH